MPLCAQFGSTVKNGQLTDFDHYSYFPQKLSYSRRVTNEYKRTKARTKVEQFLMGNSKLIT